eukprot:scaffold1183_cov418-Prasinococcus_capsulatus_cf.AAC.14
MILHDVAHNAIAVEVAAPTMRAEIFLEDDLHVGHVVPVPERTEKSVGESHDDQVLHNFLAEVVIDAVQLILAEKAAYLPVQLLRCLQVAPERLLNHHSRPARHAHGVAVNVFAHLWTTTAGAKARLLW